MPYINKGFDPEKILEFRNKLKELGKSFLLVNSEDNSDEYMNFQFLGVYEGREVIYDAAIYTLRLQHSSEIYEIAEHKAAKKFKNFKPIKYHEDENGNLIPLTAEDEEMGLYMAEVMADLEEEEAVKVQEHIEIDDNVDFGVALDIGLNVEKVTDKVISKFIKEFNEDTIKLDTTMYSFINEDDEEE
jgi:hypothetical protein